MASPPARSPGCWDSHTIWIRFWGAGQNNPDGSSRQKFAKRLQPDQPLWLVREPDNRYDRNAIMVCTQSKFLRPARQLGYLSEELASEYARVLDAGGRIDVKVAQVTGGGGMFWWKKNYGVNIHVTVYGFRSEA